MTKGGKMTKDTDGDPIVLSDTEYPLVQSPIKKAGDGNKRRQILLLGILRMRFLIFHKSIQPRRATGMMRY